MVTEYLSMVTVYLSMVTLYLSIVTMYVKEVTIYFQYIEMHTYCSLSVNVMCVIKVKVPVLLRQVTYFMYWKKMSDLSNVFANVKEACEPLILTNLS